MSSLEKSNDTRQQRTLDEKIRHVMSFEGPIVACVTPFNPDGRVGLAAIKAYAKYLASIGVVGIYAHGTTGEGASLTNDEKKSLTKTWWEVIQSDYPSWLGIFNISHICITETLDQAKFYDELGVDAIAFLPPFYHLTDKDDQLIEYMKLIAISAPNTPLIYYHFPNMTHVNLKLKEFVFKAKQQLPTFIGMKYTSVDSLELSRLHCSPLLELPLNFKVFTGYEQTILSMAALGVNGAICASFNFEEVVNLYTQLKQNLKDGKSARALQAKINDFVDGLTSEDSFISNVKKSLNELTGNKHGFTVGLPRPPFM